MNGSKIKTSIFWLLISIGFILHNSYHLAELLFFGKDIQLPDAKGKIPMAVHIFRLVVELPIMLLAFLSLYIEKKNFYRFGFIWAILLSVLNIIHFVQTLIHEPVELSQLALLLFIFITNLILVHHLHRLATPWQFLPKKLQNWQWAKHQKRWFGKWHSYLGIFAGSILVIVGLTGSILVFQDEIDQALNPELFEVAEQEKRISIDEIIPIVQKKYPEKPFHYVSIAEENNLLTTYRFLNTKTDEEFFINPFNVEICGKRLFHSSFIRIVMNIHRTLLIPTVGRYVVGLAALSLLILTISGLRLWIPKKWKQLKSALTVNFKANFKRQNYDWHQVLGLYSAPIIVVLSLTGLVITFNSVFIGLLFMLSGKSPQATQEIFTQKSNYKKEFVQMPTNEVAKNLEPIFKNAKLQSIMMPSDSSAAYMFYYKTKGITKTGNLIMAAADQYSGKLLLNSETDFPPTGKSYMNWTTSLHYGTFGGWPTIILALLGSLIPLAMFVTGFIIWWPRYKKQQASGVKVLGQNQIAKTKKIIHEKRLLHLPLSKYFIFHLKNSFRYAFWILIIGLLCGVLYGAISGIVIAPAMYVFLYIGMMVIVNFVVSLLVVLLDLIAFSPFGKTYKPIYRYFAYSLAFLLIFLPLVLGLSWSGWDLF